VRHPIYTSLLCTLCGVGFIVATWKLLALSIVAFVAGTEIRVAVEEKLLHGRFSEAFEKYRRSTFRYVPLIR
jgi:protein-S-isoprenylcysteine O-methyltransferase Ste14